MREYAECLILPDGNNPQVVIVMMMEGSVIVNIEACNNVSGGGGPGHK